MARWHLRLAWMLNQLGSVRLAIWLLAALTVASLLGGLIPQIGVTADAEEIHRSYGPLWYTMVRLFSLGNVFGSWWFTTLIALFFANLVICTGRRLHSSVRRMRRPPRALADPDLDSAAYVDVTGIDTPASSVYDLTVNVLKRASFRTYQMGDQIVGQRWRWGRLAPDVVHLGVAVILIGAVLGVYRFEERLFVGEHQLGHVFLPCSPDESAQCLQHVPFGLRVDAFGAEAHPSSPVYSGFWTSATVVEDGEEIMTQRIELNRPLSYRGISFYQSFYGHDLKSSVIKVSIVDWERRENVGTFTVHAGESVRIPGTDDIVYLARFFTTLALDRDGHPVNLSTPTPQSPVAELAVYRTSGNQVIRLDSVFAHAYRPTPYAGEDIPYGFHLESFTVPSYVGLTYTHDPGYPLVWWGFVLVMVGLFGSLYLRPRQVWIVIDLRARRLFLIGDRRTTTTLPHWLQAIAQAISQGLQGED